MTNTTKKGYTINHDNKAITLTKAYEKRASTPGAKEFKELSQLHRTFADYDIVMRTATIKAKKTTHNGLSIAMIEKIIACQANADELKREYKALVKFWGSEVADKNNPGQTVIKAPYGKVKSWFLKKVPNYQEIDLLSGATT